MHELILGGARSGKSALAERLALVAGLEVIYLATATAGDGEMSERIRQHQQRRPAHWQLLEEPLELATTLQTHARDNRLILVDCLTLWLSNLLAEESEELFQQQRASLLASLPALPGRIIFVSNEVGMGIVPMGELTRRFVDEAGRLHQDLAQICDRVTLVVAGLPNVFKGDPLE